MGFFYNHLGHKIISACLGKKAFTNNPYLGFVIEAEECDVIPDELYRLSVAYRKGEFMLPQNNKKSREFCLKAAKKGHACTQLGAMRWVMNYENDHNDEVIYWLKSAAAKGEPQALYNMAISFHRGDVGGEPDLKESNKLLRLSAEYGYPSAFARMAQVYSVGDVIDQNINIAKCWACLYYNTCKSNDVSGNGLLSSLLTAESLNEDNQIDCDKIIQDAAIEGETDAISNIANTLYKTGRVDDAVKY